MPEAPEIRASTGVMQHKDAAIAVMMPVLINPLDAFGVDEFCVFMIILF